MSTETIITAATSERISSFVDNVVSQKIDTFAESLGIPDKSLPIPKGKDFEEYLSRTYEKYSIINTLVFHNSQRQLKEIYVAQTLVNDNDYYDTTKIDKLPVDLIKKYKKILITDTAGMGKSTIMKRMFIDLIDSGMEDIGIPIYIELNRLKKDRAILLEIQEELNSLSREFNKELLLKLIQTGGFIFFMDGYDEISLADRTEVTQGIQAFISKAGTKNYYFLTSRPEGNLPSFGDFQSFSIQRLTKEEAYELLEKYDLSKNKVVSRNLIELLKSGEYDSIDEYLVNPLLVSLLFTAYDYNRSIPFEKHRFYGLVFDAFFEKHDSSKPLKSRDKHSGLNYDAFYRVLRYVGYDCLVKTGVQFNQETILDCIRKAKEFCGNLVFSEYDFLKDLITTVPLFCHEGTDYKWVHKSLLEYFAASFIYCDAKQNQDKILSAIYNSSHFVKYINMLDIYFDIDYKGFSKNITLPLCESYLRFYSSHFIDVNISRNLIDERLAFLFMGKFAFMLKNDDITEAKDYHAFGDLGFSNHDIEGWGFGEIEDAKDTKDTNEISDITMFAYVASSFDDSILMFLFRKVPLLFTKSRKEDSSKVYSLFRESNFEPNRAYLIDEKTGCEDNESYDGINQMIIPNRHYHLNYEACKIEVERIKNEIDYSDVIVLLSSI